MYIAISNYKQTETTIRAQNNLWPDEDMFVVMKAEKDDRFRSNWIVIGKNKGTIDFKLPDISEASKAEFSAFDKWHYERFENVKFLEKDPTIDWINFFHDYNVLLVSYRDPLK